MNNHYPNLPDYTGDYRPTLITMLCVIGIMFNIVTILIILILPESQLALLAEGGAHFTLIHILDSVLAICAYLGLWQMRLWAALLYFLTVAGMLFYHFVMQHTVLFWSIAPSLIALLIVLFYTKDMMNFKR